MRGMRALKFITGHVIYTYTYKFQLKTTSIRYLSKNFCYDFE
mgnify:CR=1 FL=1